jgi:flagellar biogenesis protein FliO
MTNDWSTWWALVKVALLLVGMVLMGRYLPTLLDRFSPGTLKRQRRLRLLDTLHLGADRSVHLVEVDGARLVLGATRTGIQLLKQLADGQGNDGLQGDGKEGQTDAVES